MTRDSKKSVPRDLHRAEVESALARVRAVLEARGVLLRQDLALPCVTTLVVGEPIRGSWWGHPENKLIYDTLDRLEAETAHVKLLNEKVTLVHRRLWPELAAIGQSRAEWQLDGISRASRKDPRPSRASDAAPTSSTSKRAGRRATISSPSSRRRLLVHAYDLHTERGFHVRVLEPWSAWQRDHGVAGELPRPAEAMKAFERAIEGWPKARLPWS